MASWADEANGEMGSVDQENFKAERIISQTKDGREMVKVITEIRKNEAGERMKVEREVKITKKMIRVNKAVRSRRTWAKFGDCEGQEHGFKETGVVNIAEPVMFELAGQEETKDQQSTKGVGNLLNMDTFSALRQLRNKVTSGEITEEEYQAERFKLLGKAAPEGGAAGPDSMEDGPGGKGGYVPPHLRNRDGGGENKEEQQATLRVTNVSTDATRDDMHELFRRYGPIARVSVPTDRVTGEGRGFAFIDFYNHADAAKAIEALHGTGFDSLILNVDWARPSADGEQRGGYRGGGGGGGGGDRGDRGGDRGGGYGDRGGGGGYGDRGGGYGDRGGGDRGGGYGDRGDRGGGYGGRSMADSNASRFGRDRDAPSAADSGPWRR